jgi:hypothetical protein
MSTHFLEEKLGMLCVYGNDDFGVYDIDKLRQFGSRSMS